uniref:Putative NAC domain class transcription factor n=1 Tax=Tamarix hispida TaxID=189793 RepID=T2CB66_9CARY|nr:putative NAC domain class transcription factor [Tamarix hispida]
MALSNDDKRLPPGFRFHPTDAELIMYYLKRKILGKRLCHNVISELDIYRYAPWDLPSWAGLRSGDLNWYFFCPCKKYGSSGRSNRATEIGYWKSTGNDRDVDYKDRVVGKIKTLVFHLGKPPKGERKDWVMHEFRLDDPELTGVAQDAYVICKIFKKSGLGPKNGEQYGAPFREEDWEDDVDNNQIQVGAASTSLPGGHSCINDQENSDMGHVNRGNGDCSLSAVEQISSHPNVPNNLIPAINELPGQSQSPLIFYDDNDVDLEALLALFDDDGNAGMAARGNTQDHRQSAEAEGEDIFAALESLDEFHYSSYFSGKYTAAPSLHLDGNFLEEKDLDDDY